MHRAFPCGSETPKCFWLWKKCIKYIKSALGLPHDCWPKILKIQSGGCKSRTACLCAEYIQCTAILGLATCLSAEPSDMGVSKNRGYPQIIHFNRVCHYKSSFLGYPYFWKHPYRLLDLDILDSSIPIYDFWTKMAQVWSKPQWPPPSSPDSWANTMAEWVAAGSTAEMRLKLSIKNCFQSLKKSEDEKWVATHCWTNTFALPRKWISKSVSICSTRIQLDEALRTRRNPPAHLPKDVESMGQPWQRQPSPMCLASASHSSTGDESHLWLKDIKSNYVNNWWEHLTVGKNEFISSFCPVSPLPAKHRERTLQRICQQWHGTAGFICLSHR